MTIDSATCWPEIPTKTRDIFLKSEAHFHRFILQGKRNQEDTNPSAKVPP